LNFKVEEFPEKVRKYNQGIFNDWKGLFKTLDKCTDWTPLLRNQLNLRLQNLPRENGMFQVVLRMIFLTQSTAMDPLNELFDNFSMLTRQLLNDLPVPSEFA